MKIIPLTRAKARFSEIVERLIQTEEQVVITKWNKPVAAILPYDGWVKWNDGEKGGLAKVTSLDENLDAEIDKMVEEIYEARRKSKGRKVRL